MKNKKLFLPIFILVAAVLAVTISCVIIGIAKKPTVTEGEFPFSFTYELDGESVTVEDVFYASYSKNGGYSNSKSRIYSGKIGDMEEGENSYTLRHDENGTIVLLTHLHADYLMGDAWYDYFDDRDFAPELLYYDTEDIEYTDEETLLANGAKLISFEYPTPIENSFVFSHISRPNSDVVLPAMIILLLTMVATIIFVKRDNETPRKPIDVVSTVFNYLFGIITVPVFTFLAYLTDAFGGNGDFVSQFIYFLAPLTVLGITLSIALRRKGYGVIGFAVQFIAPGFLMLIMLLSNLGLIR